MTTRIFFDLDGTISDPREGIVHCLQYALERLGHAAPPEQQLVRYIGPPLYESLGVLLNSTDAALVKRAVESYRERFVAKGLFENSLYPGIPDVLEKLRDQHYQLHIVTSKLTTFARQIVGHFGLEGFFHKIHGSELDGTRADKKDLIAHVLNEEQIHPTDAVMIGDREHDIRGALMNGVRPIGVLWGYGSRDELTQAGASVLCDTPESLAKHFS
jgi:phosphoglycolate phosphatase